MHYFYEKNQFFISHISILLLDPFDLSSMSNIIIIIMRTILTFDIFPKR